MTKITTDNQVEIADNQKDTKDPLAWHIKQHKPLKAFDSLLLEEIRLDMAQSMPTANKYHQEGTSQGKLKIDQLRNA